MKRLTKLVRDFHGLVRICGPFVAFQWLVLIVLNIGEVLRRGDLQPADEAMGAGPFDITISQYGCKFRTMSPRVVSTIREMYVRDVYLRNGWIKIRPNSTVVDLGANTGDFTNLALAVDPSIRVIAVEPSKYLNAVFAESVGLNAGFLDRTKLIRAFIGQIDKKQEQVIAEDESYANAEWLSEEEFIRRTNIAHVDFLKCDIEGSEFGLLTRNSRLLKMTRALACEVHAFAGDVPKFLAEIEACGFIIGPIQRDPDGTVTFLAKRDA